MYLPTASDDNDQYQHLPAMPGPSAMRFHSFALASSQLYITCALAEVTLLSEQLILGPNACSTLSSSLLFTLGDSDPFISKAEYLNPGFTSAHAWGAEWTHQPALSSQQFASGTP